jgi:hypothetical protein
MASEAVNSKEMSNNTEIPFSQSNSYIVIAFVGVGRVGWWRISRFVFWFVFRIRLLISRGWVTRSVARCRVLGLVWSYWIAGWLVSLAGDNGNQCCDDKNLRIDQ